MIIKYGSLYISWYNVETHEFGVDTIDKAFKFDDIKWFVMEFGISEYEVV